MVKFQQISTLAGNLVPSYFEGEVLFTMAIVGLGLLLFALLIGNMQNFLQALGSRYVVIPMVVSIPICIVVSYDFTILPWPIDMYRDGILIR
jgi:hypothetical protein